MLRFGYYLAVNVALLSAFAIWWTASGALELGEIEALRDVETYQILGIALLLVLVVPGNVVAIDSTRPTWETAEFLSASNTDWQNELDWVRENTPEPPLDYDERTMPPEDGDFDYPEGAYGVMSWWDYGHWITKTGERIPNANPFQEGPRAASPFLLAESEERANLILEALPSLQDSTNATDQMSNEELRAVIANQTDQEASEDTRYVMIDDQMAAIRGISQRSSGKFAPITQWIDTPFDVYTSTRNRTIRTGNGTTQVPLYGTSERYERTMLSRLYYDDAVGLEHYRLVHETETPTTFVSIARRTGTGAYERIGQAGIVNAIFTPRLSQALQANPNLVPYDIRQESRVKTFERVDGARLTGQVDAERLNGTNATVLAEVELRTTSRNRTFTYRTQTRTNPDGSFSVTVPYPTTNDVSPEEGGTNASVTATGNYSVTVARQILPIQGRIIPIGTIADTSAEVPEQAIYDGSEIALELDPVVRYEEGTLNATLGESQIANGSTTDLTVTAGFTNDTTRTVTDAATFASNDTSVATVDNGTITATGPGVARINASYRGETVSVTLTVENASEGNAASLDPQSEGDAVGPAAAIVNRGVVAPALDRAGT